MNHLTKWLLEDGWLGLAKFLGTVLIGALIFYWAAIFLFVGSCLLLGALFG